MKPIELATAEALVAAAVRAPSSHNTQPWWFRCVGETIELYADRTRALPVNDPFDRELTISCGAALFNLCVAAEAVTFTPEVHLLPGGGADLLASVTCRPAASASTAELADAIASRRTHRDAFSTHPVPSDLAGRLEAVAPEHGVTLAWVPAGPKREGLAELVARGSRAQFDDPSWRRELASWMHPRRRGDGLVGRRSPGR